MKKILTIVAMAMTCTACSRVEPALPLAASLIAIGTAYTDAADRQKAVIQLGAAGVAANLVRHCASGPDLRDCDAAVQVLWSAMSVTEGKDDLLTDTACVGAKAVRLLFLADLQTNLQIRQYKAHEDGQASSDEWYTATFKRIDQQVQATDGWCKR